MPGDTMSGPQPRRRTTIAQLIIGAAKQQKAEADATKNAANANNHVPNKPGAATPTANGPQTPLAPTARPAAPIANGRPSFPAAGPPTAGIRPPASARPPSLSTAKPAAGAPAQNSTAAAKPTSPSPEGKPPLLRSQSTIEPKPKHDESPKQTKPDEDPRANDGKGVRVLIYIFFWRGASASAPRKTLARVGPSKYCSGTVLVWPCCLAGSHFQIGEFSVARLCESVASCLANDRLPDATA